MGSRAKRPPLPTATDSDLGAGTAEASDDLGTDLTTRTQNSFYTIPETGLPIRIPTGHKRGGLSDNQSSQASLLIDLYETKSKEAGRPSVRVRVSSGGKPVKITEHGKARKTSHKRRVSIEDKGKRYSWEAAEDALSQGANRGPVEVDFNNKISEVSSNLPHSHPMENMSDVSSMPADSTLGGPLEFKAPPQSRSKSISDLGDLGIADTASGKTKTLSNGRSRSRSRERREYIERKAAEKVRAIEGSPEESGRRRIRKSREKTSSNGSRRSSKTHSQRDSGDYNVGTGTGTEASLRPKDADSNLSVSNTSQLSKSSLANNPKLLGAVEDAIRRMILPEIDEIKRKQSVHDGKGSKGARESYRTETTDNRDVRGSESSRDGEDLKSKKVRRSSKDAKSEGRSSRRTSASSTKDVDARKSKSRTSRHSSHESEGLTTAALKDHNKLARDKERRDERDEQRERRKKRSQSKSDSRTDSIAHTDDEYYDKSKIPPMPMQSVNESDLTRDSIMSAETSESYTDRPTSSRKPETPIQEVARASPSEVPLPDSRASNRTPLQSESRSKTFSPRNLASPLSGRSDRSLQSASSDKSISSKARHAALTAAGLGGAAGGLYAAHSDKTERSRSRQTDRAAAAARDVSPVQIDTSNRKSQTREEEVSQEQGRPATVSSVATEKDPAKVRSLSSGRSTPSTQHGSTTKRHQSVTSEGDRDAMDGPSASQKHTRDFPKEGPSQPDGGSRNLQNINTKYVSGVSDWNAQRQSYSDSLASPEIGRDFAEQHVKQVAANPQFSGTPQQAQSETGSILNQSQLSSNPSANDTPEQSFSTQSFKARELAQEGSGDKSVMLNEEENSSQDRWRSLKEKARVLSASREELENNDNQAKSQSRQLQNDVRMGANGIPSADEPMPEIGFGHDDNDLTNPSLREKQSSVLVGPLGDENENRDHWPYEPTPTTQRVQGWPQEDRDELHVSAGNAALAGAAAGLGIAAGSSGARAVSGPRPMQDPPPRQPSERSQSSTSMAGVSQHGSRHNWNFSPGNLKDEGYISAAAPRSPGNGSPLSFSKEPPTLWSEKDRRYDPAAIDEDPFTDEGKRSKHFSGNSHGMATGYYDASTGKGIDNIQSADIVALMDHLSARDGQRSARDSELIYTLIQSATDTRQNFDQVKQLIEVQKDTSLKNQDKNTDRLMSRIMGGPKPQILGSPRTPTGGSTEDVPAKKQNIFKRALKGLGSKSSTDVSRIEDMLVQLLDEVETLKAARASSAEPQATAGATRGSMDSEQRLQQPADPGYEPEGQAGTGSTPSHSGYFSPQAPRSHPRMHLGTGMDKRISTNRVSTVFEDEGEFDDGDNRLQTPTQEARQHQRSVSYETPPKPTGPVQDYGYSPNAQRGSEERSSGKSYRHMSFPKISRWSKTTEDSSTDKRFSTDTAGPAGRPYSEALSQESHSGEAINVIPGAGGQPWQMHDDDRLKSANSFAANDNVRSHSPLIPEQASASREIGSEVSPESAGDPKYNNFKHASLPLQHPQPRQGRTGRHRNHLENEAYNFDQDDNRDSGSPGDELFGSVPALSRISGGGYGASRMHQNGGAAVQNQHGMVSPPSSGPSDPNSPHTSYRSQPAGQQAAPARPPKIQEPPSIPPKINFPLSGPTQEPTPTYTRDGGSSPAQSARTQSLTSSALSSHASLDGSEDDPLYPLESLDRKRSPYMPGGPLAPIEERYSMEGDRSSLAYSLSQRSRRQSTDGGARESGSRGHSRAQSGNEQYPTAHLAQVAEGDERAITPTKSPRSAVGAEERNGGGEVRKLTGPREMPGNATGGLRGAVRRKPVYGELS